MNNIKPIDSTVKAYAAFLHRCKGFSDDGYTLIFQHQGEAIWYYKFRHPNGNTIDLKLFPKELRIVQLTNGRESHTATMHQS